MGIMVSAQNLRSHVGGGTDVVVGLSPGFLQGRCKPKIPNFDMSRLNDKQILRLEVPVHNALKVEVFISLDHLPDVVPGLPLWQFLVFP
jgi:hypothetical protein